jgi:hypothetical protein
LIFSEVSFNGLLHGSYIPEEKGYQGGKKVDIKQGRKRFYTIASRLV